MGDELERLANVLNDWDANWWPFLFLRPRRETRLGVGRVLLLAALYGAFVGTLGNLVFLACGRKVHPFELPLAATAGCFVLYSLFAHFWNRRAARLAASMARSRELRRR